MEQAASLNNLRVGRALAGQRLADGSAQGEPSFEDVLSAAEPAASQGALVASLDADRRQELPGEPVRLGKKARPLNLRDEVGSAQSIDLAQIAADELKTAGAPRLSPPVEPVQAEAQPHAQRGRGIPEKPADTTARQDAPVARPSAGTEQQRAAPFSSSVPGTRTAQTSSVPTHAAAAGAATAQPKSSVTNDQRATSSQPVAAAPVRVVTVERAGNSRVHGVGGVARAHASSRAMLDRLASQAPARSPAAHEPPVAQVARGLAAVLKHGGGTAVLRLQPEHLGQLRVEVTVQDGEVSARMEASNDSARELLLDSKETLRAALEARGLSVERIEVETVRPRDGVGGDPQPHDGGGFDAGGDDPGGDRRQPQGAPHGESSRPEFPGEGPHNGDPLTLSVPGAISYGPDAHAVYRLRLDAVA